MISGKMYQYDKPDNLVELIENSVAKYPDNPMFGTKNESGIYEWATYKEVGERIDNLRSGLAQLGIGKGDAVGIIAKNRTEWAIAAFATYGLGGCYIPMYENELVKIWKYIINDGGVKTLLVSTPEIYNQVQSFSDEVPNLEKVFHINGDGENSMEELERIGKDNPINSIHPKPDEIAVLIYTSGTTGNPKGVLLSHGNFTTNVHAGSLLFPEVDKNDRSLSILPWAHSFGQTGELYNFMKLGASIGFVEDVTTIVEDIAKVKPTFLIAVPRVFNKIYDGIQTKINETGGLTKKLFLMGIESAKKMRKLAEKDESGFLTGLKFKMADVIVFKKIRQQFGGRLKGSITGSATMNVEIAHFFSDIGISLYDCYGLTETSPAATMNCPVAHKPGSVGRPIDQVTVKIDQSVVEEGAHDGEIIVYGPNVMQGYHNNPEATRQAMTDDGGFRTGDRGWVDEDGFLFVTGRIKEQYKLENGKYVFPAALEEEIRLHPWVENVMIYGEGKAYNICMVVPDFAPVGKWANENNFSGDPETWVQTEEVKTKIQSEITDFLKDKFRSYEIPKEFIITNRNFSIEDGTLTQTMKVKRRTVLERYEKEIEAIYAKQHGS